MVKKIFVLALLVLLITNVSAFCAIQGHILNEDGIKINATKINVVCKRAEGDLLYTQPYGDLFGFPFGDWYDDCSYCDLGIFVNAVDSINNAYNEIVNLDCSVNELKFCDVDIYLKSISGGESASSKDGYSNIKPDVGPLVENPKPMPKSNESPETKINGIKDEPTNYTFYYFSIGIIGIILIIIALKNGKK